jgi:hypothetical protein
VIPIEASSWGGLYDELETDVAYRLERAAIHGGKFGRPDFVKSQHLLRQALISGQQQSRRARARIAHVQQVQSHVRQQNKAGAVTRRPIHSYQQFRIRPL